jgi:hypothetical protein
MTNKIGVERIVITIPDELKKDLVWVGIETNTSMSEAARYLWKLGLEVYKKMEAKDE